MGIQTALDAVTEAPRLIDAMRLADDLAFEAGREPGVRTLRVLATALHGDDDVAAIAAIHALAEVFDQESGRMLVALLDDGRAFVREHAAWALASGLPRLEAMGRLTAMVADGGFTGMIAQRTLEQWSTATAAVLAVSLETALLGITEPGARARLVETLGLVRDPLATRPLVRIARDPAEDIEARVAAVAALGQRRDAEGPRAVLAELAADPGRLGGAARLSLIDLEPAPERGAAGTGLTVAQLFLHADIDPHLSAAGSGDNGGVATLLVRLGDALAAESTEVDRVLTLSRGVLDGAVDDLRELPERGDGHQYGRIPLRPDPVPSAAAWPLRVTARRGIRRILRAAGRVDVLHLRMADVGSLAAADVARELGIPVVFTVAPDPHAVIHSLDRAGELTRESFGEVDLREHYWFRTRLVHNLAANAAHTVLFPRPELARDMRELVGIDIGSYPERHTIVAEGVDIAVVDAAVDAAAAGAEGPALAELRALLEGLPPERRGLPLVVSVGRLHRVKGMATLVEVWATSGLAERSNLLLVGGDLAAPSADEREQLARIDAVIPAAERVARGLLLAGHRRNDVAARWLAAARFGVPGLAAPGGVYVCASLKEEFGIALLEAMATGLLVVAPDGGGPATYVADGDTGILAATWDRAALASALDRALDRALDDETARADRARAMVRDHFTIQAMARALGPVYRGVADDEAELVRAAGEVG